MNKSPNTPESGHDDIDDVLEIMKKRHSGTPGQHTNGTQNENHVFSIEAVDQSGDDVKKFTHSKKNSENSPETADISAANTVSEKSPIIPETKIIPKVTPPTDATKIDLPTVRKNNAVSDSKPIQHTQNTPADTSSVSLDDFNTAEKKSNHTPASRDGKVKVTFLGSVWFGIIKIIVYIAAILVVSAMLSMTIINLGNDIFAFVKDDTEITVTLPVGADTKEVAEILEKAGVIEYPTAFEMWAKSKIKKRARLTGKYLEGEITVNPSMNYDKLLDVLSDYERDTYGTVRITIPEGLTVNETIDLLVENGVGKKENYYTALQEFEYEYKFAAELTKENLSEYRFDTNYSYRLEGYLFPDTYDFYLNENPVSALDKFLTNFNKKFEEEYYERAAELGMTVDEVITLASLIEKEGNNPSDYYYISSVFHNRLNNSANFPYLNSDASLQYALSERTGLYSIDTSMDHPYNTYNHRGLPPGPICNPGIQAIDAALYPENTNYYYFYTKKNGETVFSKTYEEHQRYVNQDK